MNISLPQVSSCTSPRGIDARIHAAAARQHELITTSQLLEIGLTSGAITKRVRTKRLRRLHQGVYTTSHGALTPLARYLAAARAGGQGAIVSYRAAAEVWEMSRFDVMRPSILVPHRHRPITGVDVHHTGTLRWQDSVIHRHVPVSAPARTMLDLGDELTRYQLANVMHMAAFRRLLNDRRVEEMVAVGRGRHACTVLAEALALHRRGSIGTRSAAEDRYLELVADARLRAPRVPEPRVNERVHVVGRSIEVDFHWPALRRIVEVDGVHHRRPANRLDDAGRDALLHAAGWLVVRVSAREVFASGPELVLHHAGMA